MDMGSSVQVSQCVSSEIEYLYISLYYLLIWEIVFQIIFEYFQKANIVHKTFLFFTIIFCVV